MIFAVLSGSNGSTRTSLRLDAAEERAHSIRDLLLGVASSAARASSSSSRFALPRLEFDLAISLIGEDLMNPKVRVRLPAGKGTNLTGRLSGTLIASTSQPKVLRGLRLTSKRVQQPIPTARGGERGVLINYEHLQVTAQVRKDGAPQPGVPVVFKIDARLSEALNSRAANPKLWENLREGETLRPLGDHSEAYQLFQPQFNQATLTIDSSEPPYRYFALKASALGLDETLIYRAEPPRPAPFGTARFGAAEFG